MSAQLTTYSGKDVNFTFVSALTGSIQASGVSGQGIKRVTVKMAVDQSVLEVGMDGSVVPSVVPGDQGTIEVEVFQTSTLQQEFLAAYNAVKTARDLGDVSNWYGNSILIQNIVDGSKHNGQGAGFLKFPDKNYGTQAATVTWAFLCCNIVNQ